MTPMVRIARSRLSRVALDLAGLFHSKSFGQARETTNSNANRRLANRNDFGHHIAGCRFRDWVDLV